MPLSGRTFNCGKTVFLAGNSCASFEHDMRIDREINISASVFGSPIPDVLSAVMTDGC